MKIPKLRFKDFTEQWQTKTLGEIAKFSKGKGISKIDISEDGITECIRYGELYTFYGETINEIKSRTNINIKDLVLSEANDVIIPASGETHIDIATASCVLKTGIALGGDLNIIRTKHNGVFLAYYLNSKKKYDIATLAQGTSVVHLYASQLAMLSISLPSLAEQTKIGAFLSSVDDKIQALTQKKKLLEQYKKGVMQQLFSQEIRFKDENNKDFEDWTEKTLGEICVNKSSNISANKIQDNFGEYIIYGASGILKKVDFYKEENDYISIIKDGAGVGRLFYCKGKTSVLSTMQMIKPKPEIDTYFLYYIMHNIDFIKYIVGSTIPHIYFKDYSQEIFLIPCLAEQTQIASFLSSLDEKIHLVGVQLTGTKKYKKGLLQEIFV